MCRFSADRLIVSLLTCSKIGNFIMSIETNQGTFEAVL